MVTIEVIEREIKIRLKNEMVHNQYHIQDLAHYFD